MALSFQNGFRPSAQASTLGALAGYGTGGISATSPREEIKTLQRALNYWTNANLAVDGVFGSRTFAALESAMRGIDGFIPTGYWASDNMLAALGIMPGGRFENEPGAGGTSDFGGGNPIGDGNTGGSTVSGVRFEWKAPAAVSGALTWGRAQEAFGQAMQAAGFAVEYNSYEFSFGLSYAWTLVVRGIAPMTDRDTINNTLIRLAEQSGFNVATENSAVTLGSTVSSGNPNNSTGDSLSKQIQNFFSKQFSLFGSPVSGSTLIIIAAGLYVATKKR